MAKPKDAPAEAKTKGPAPAPSTATARTPGKRKRMVVIAMSAAAVLGLGGAGAWYFLGHKEASPQSASPHSASPPARAKSKPSAPPLFVTLEPFVVNLAGDVQHYLQVGIEMRVADGSVPDKIKLHLPEIRNGVLLLLSSKKVEDLVSMDQKNLLRDEIREAANKPLGINTPAPKPVAAEAEAFPQPLSEAQAGVPLSTAPPANSTGAKPAKPVERVTTADFDIGVLEVLLTSFLIQ